MSVSRFRLSPSGPFVGAPPLQVGSDGSLGTGSPGLVWRQLGDSSSIDLQSATRVSLLSSVAADGFSVPVGYHYELEAWMKEVSNAAPGSTTWGFEESLDDGTTWTAIVSHVGGGVTNSTGISFDPPVTTATWWGCHVIDYDATGKVLVGAATPGIRIRVTGRSTTAAAGCMAYNLGMRVTQFAH